MAILQKSTKTYLQLSLISHDITFYQISPKCLHCRQIWRRLSHGFLTIWNVQLAQARVTEVNLFLHCMPFYDMRVSVKGKVCQEHERTWCLGLPLTYIIVRFCRAVVEALRFSFRAHMSQDITSRQHHKKSHSTGLD